MNWIGKLWTTVFLLALAFIAARATAQEAEPPPQICVGGRHWQPTFEEIRQIDTAPIPTSYREQFESTGPCDRWALDEPALIDLHLKFGTTKTAAVALGYLEKDYMRSAPQPERYVPVLRQSFRAAVPDLREAAMLRQPEGLNYSVSYRFRQKSSQVQRFQALLLVREHYMFLAKQYLRAAEEFTDAAFLDRAQKYLSPALEGGKFLDPLESQPPVKGQMYFNLDLFETDDLAARAALLRARLTGAPTDIANARAIMEAQHRDEYDVAAQYAYSGGNSFCDISSGSNRARELDAACKQQHDLLVRVVDYFINRAVLDQIIDGATDPERADDSFRDAVRLLSFEKAPDVNRRCCGRSADEDILRLLTSKAHFLARYVRQHREESVEKADNMEWRQALDALRQAAQLASPETAPRRFQRIANDWLMLYKDGDTLCRQPCYPYSPRADVDWRRYAVYLHSVLGEIEEISRGSAD